jgi:hypothetical protein
MILVPPDPLSITQLFALYMIKQGRLIKSLLFTRAQDTHSGHRESPVRFCSENLHFRNALDHTPKGR